MCEKRLTPFSGRGKVKSCKVAGQSASGEVESSSRLRCLRNRGHGAAFYTFCFLGWHLSPFSRLHASLPPLLRPHGHVLSVLAFPTARLFALESWICVFGPNQSLMCFETTEARRLGPAVASFSDWLCLRSCPAECAPSKV